MKQLQEQIKIKIHDTVVTCLVAAGAELQKYIQLKEEREIYLYCGCIETCVYYKYYIVS